MRWPPDPQTLKKKQKHKQKTTNRKKKNTHKTKKNWKKNRLKMSFSVISQNILFVLVLSKNPLFWQLGPKSAHPKNRIKNRGETNFWKTTIGHKTAIFGSKKPQPNIPVILFFVLSSLWNAKNTNCWNPILYSVFGKHKKDNFQKSNPKQGKLKKDKLHPKKKTLFLENRLISGPPKTHNDNWVCKTIAWNHYKHRLRMSFAHITIPTWPR